ncbi:MAG: sugar ABC transporter ATP-binding protein [Anaerolineae bacterium]|nr:sugar ABC transporter ATP-binding protein [Anaerolineae bacterium]
MVEPILVATQITKHFPGVRALDNVDLELLPGEVHALVGENGAGKSTLIKVLGGQHRPTSGALLMNGQPVHFDNPLQAQTAGISVIHQEFNLIPQLSIAENIFLGREPVRAGGLIDWGQIRERSAAILKELGLDISPNLRVEYLSVADKQLVEVAKALSQDFRVMIMDEPTAALNSAEVERLFEIIADLRQRGVAVLYVSHRLSEIFRIADRVTVLRDGRRVDTRPIGELTERDVVTMMLGRALADYEVHKGDAPHAAPALAVRDLTVASGLNGVSFDLHFGEVLGVAGLVGSGRSELMRVLFGILPRKSGDVLLEGRAIHLKDAMHALREGIFMLPEDRKVEGIFPDLNVLENLVIKRARPNENAARRAFLARRAERTHYDRIRDLLAVRAQSPGQLISTLSGGNQQKIVLGRALVSQARILLLNEPSRGVDVGTKVEIHELIRQLANDGHAVMVSSSDVPELVKVSDRCLVLSAGRITGMLQGANLTEDNILACAVAHATLGV